MAATAKQYNKQHLGGSIRLGVELRSYDSTNNVNLSDSTGQVIAQIGTSSLTITPGSTLLMSNDTVFTTGGTVSFTALPTGASGLSNGYLYNEIGIVKVVGASGPYLNGTRTIKDFVTDVSVGSTTSSQSIFNYSIPANTLTDIGQKVIAEYTLTTVGNLETDIILSLNGTPIFSFIVPPLSGETYVNLRSIMIRDTSTTFKTQTTISYGSGVVINEVWTQAVPYGNTSGVYVPIGSSNIVDVSTIVSAPGATGEVVGRFGTIKIEAAAS